MQIDRERVEALGPAERILRALTEMTDHMVHNRPGLVSRVAREVGAKWEPCTWRQEGGDKVVYVLSKQGNKRVETRAGVLQEDGKVVCDGVVLGEYRKPKDRAKLFPEIAAHLYRQMADVYQMDNDFAARWASFAFGRENRDLKVVLAAFMLVQTRAGEPVVEDGEVLFHDEDLRAVGEAMLLIREAGNRSMEPKLLVRVGDLLRLPEVAEINRQLGFGKSGRNPTLGRWPKAVTRWLRYREHNPQLLEGLVKAGMGGTVRTLARRVHYKPESERFFEILRWKQKLRFGHRTIAIGKEVAPAETWEGLSERGVCDRIVADKPGFKRVVGLLPASVGLTRAVMAACIEAGVLSDKDLIILTPTLEELGLLTIEPFASRWKAAMQAAEDQRAANVARNVRSKEAREALETAVDVATAKAFEEATRGLRVYCMVDKSASMSGALSKAQDYLARFLGGFPLEKLHVSVFNTMGQELQIRAPKRAAVEHAFRGHGAGGGTDYRSGVRALEHHRPQPDEDVLFLFVGDQGGESGALLAQHIRGTRLDPVAFGYLRVVTPEFGEGRTVESAAAELGVPCFSIDTEMFDSDDPYAVTRVLRDLIASTPAKAAAGGGGAPRVPLVEQILATPLLEPPTWASSL